MEERDDDLPVATVRPRTWSGRLAAARGTFARWLRRSLRRTFTGRHAPLLLTAIFFSGMMVAMGYVADRAQRAAEGIDEAHRAAAEAVARARDEAAAAVRASAAQATAAADAAHDRAAALLFVRVDEPRDR